MAGRGRDSRCAERLHAKMEHDFNRYPEESTMADIASVMTSNPACCKTDTPLKDVAAMMVENDCGMIPVVDADNKPVGTVTDRDIAIRLVAKGRNPLDATAADAMTSPCRHITESTSLYDATCAMEADKIRRILVVDDQGKLTGVAAIADLALAGKDEATAHVVKEVSEPSKSKTH